MDNTPNLQYLLQGHLAGNLSDQEKLTLFQLLEDKENRQEWTLLIEALYEKAGEVLPASEENDPEEMIRYILSYPPVTAEIAETTKPLTPALSSSTVPLRRISPLWWYAAAVVVLFSVGVYLWSLNRPAGDMHPVAFTKDISAPTGARATLTLGNGSTILLDSAKDGFVLKQGGVSIQKSGNDQLAYTAANSGNSPTVYNTLSTSNGGRTSVVLADGTRVWLNALSSLKYPVAFSGSQRMVELTGEGYFEIAPNRDKPFVVKKGAAEILVLGTHFNVNAYDDEEANRVTLLEGKVSILPALGQKAVVLQPGEQAVWGADATVQTSRNADLDKAIAWVNNEFDFEKDNIEVIMRQIARWYNVDILYEGTSTAHYTGHITRTAPLSQVLGMFARLGYIRFEIKGRTISIIPTGKQPG